MPMHEKTDARLDAAAADSAAALAADGNVLQDQQDEKEQPGSATGRSDKEELQLCRSQVVMNLRDRNTITEGPSSSNEEQLIDQLENAIGKVELGLDAVEEVWDQALREMQDALAEQETKNEEVIKSTIPHLEEWVHNANATLDELEEVREQHARLERINNALRRYNSRVNAIREEMARKYEAEGRHKFWEDDEEDDEEDDGGDVASQEGS